MESVSYIFHGHSFPFSRMWFGRNFHVHNWLFTGSFQDFFTEGKKISRTEIRKSSKIFTEEILIFTGKKKTLPPTPKKQFNLELEIHLKFLWFTYLLFFFPVKIKISSVKFFDDFRISVREIFLSFREKILKTAREKSIVYVKISSK